MPMFKTFYVMQSRVAGQLPVRPLEEREIGVNHADRLMHYNDNGETKAVSLDDLHPAIVDCLLNGFRISAGPR